MKAKAKRRLQGLCLALIVAGAGALAYPAHTEAKETSKWNDVCCSDTCEGGEHYCVGDGEYTCCKP